jgi:hypothetical protein
MFNIISVTTTSNTLHCTTVYRNILFTVWLGMNLIILVSVSSFWLASKSSSRLTFYSGLLPSPRRDPLLLLLLRLRGSVMGGSDGASEDVIEGISEGLSDFASALGFSSAKMIGTTLLGASEGINDGESEGISEGIPEAIEGINDGRSEGISEAILAITGISAASEGARLGISEGIMEGMSEGIMEGISEGIMED